MIVDITHVAALSHYSALYQAWQGRKRQARGHHSPSSIQVEWLAIDDQKK